MKATMNIEFELKVSELLFHTNNREETLKITEAFTRCFPSLAGIEGHALDWLETFSQEAQDNMENTLNENSFGGRWPGRMWKPRKPYDYTEDDELNFKALLRQAPPNAWRQMSLTPYVGDRHLYIFRRRPSEEVSAKFPTWALWWDYRARPTFNHLPLQLAAVEHKLAVAYVPKQSRMDNIEIAEGIFHTFHVENTNAAASSITLGDFAAAHQPA